MTVRLHFVIFAINRCQAHFFRLLQLQNRHQMEYTFTTISWILLTNFALSSAIALYSHLKGHSNHQIFFTLMMLMVAEWSIMGAIEASTTDIPGKIFWTKLSYIGALTTPVLFFRFSIGIAEIRNRWLTRNYWIFWIIPVVIILLATTNEMHHLVWKEFSWSNAGNNILVYHHGSAFIIAVIYSLILQLIAQFLIIRALPNMPGIFKQQAWSIIIANIFPFVAVIIYATGNGPIEGLDIIVLSFLATGIVLLFGITKYKIFNIAPIARRRLTEILRDALLILDTQNKIVYHNPAASKLLNIQSKYFYADLKDISWLYEECKSLLCENQSDTELIAHTPDNKWLSIQIINLLDDNKAFQGNMVVLRDITFHKNLELETNRLNQELTRSHAQLLELNAQKDKILSIIGHDVKTSFHQILSLAQILNEEEHNLDKETTTELLADVLTASQNGYGILEELLNWAKSKQESLSVKPESIQVEPFMNKIMESMKSIADSKRIRFVSSIESDAALFAEPNMITIATRNILSNAIKFSHPEGNIYINCNLQNNQINISIKDEGMGISEKDLSKLFNKEMSYSRPGTKGEKGTGLGLLLSNELIIRNNGSISVESEVGKGTIFTISLPVVN